MASKPNKLAQAVRMAQRLPASLHTPALSIIFNSMVKFAGTAGIRIHAASPSEVHMSLANKRKVQNHIGGVHACGMALLSESATGLVFGQNVPDTHIPVIKSMKIDFKKRANGALKAVATLSPEQILQIKTHDKGAVTVPVVVTDESGNSPITCEMVWAWTPKVRAIKSQDTQAQQAQQPAAAAAAAETADASQPPSKL